MSSGAHVTVPLDVLERLSPFAAQMGINLGGEARFAPEVNVSQPLRSLALELGNIAKLRDLYMKAGQLVTVNPQTGEEIGMNGSRFVGWIEEFCAMRGGKEASLSREKASLVLAQDIFRDAIRPLVAVHLMRLPVRRADGRVEFLGPGYDAESQVFTAPVLEYEMDWPAERGLAFLKEHNGEYPWAWPDDHKAALELNRSYAVHIAACLGTYCRAMFAAGTQRPMITYIANQPGTGKSTLVGQALLPVYGHASTAKTPRDDDRMAAELETVAQSMQPYLFFDDIGAGLFSAPLNRFITSESHNGRIYGQNREMFRVPNVTQVFSTGNAIKTTPDLVRRSLVAELFLAGDVAGRKFRQAITTMYLARREVRAGFLAALCSLVRCWMENGQPKHPAPLASFEDWTETVGGIMSLHDFQDPLAPPDLSSGGAEEEDEMRELLIKAASKVDTADMFDEKKLVYTRQELAEIAREYGLIESIVGATEKDMDSSASKKFGRQLQHWRGRELRDQHEATIELTGKGRLFRFAHKKQKRGATYPLTFLPDAA